MAGFVFSGTRKVCACTRKTSLLLSFHRWASKLKGTGITLSRSCCSYHYSLNASSRDGRFGSIERRLPQQSCILKKPQTRLFSSTASSSMNRSSLLLSSKTHRNSASITATSTAETGESQNTQTSLLRQRFIYVQTSVNRWEDVPGGVMFDTAYLDSAPGDRINPAVPLIVSLHSTPGSFYDVLPVLEACVKAGCRVLAPAFPGQDMSQH